MILVLSRFKVANDSAPAVREAFLHRPRLVDRVPGFLGIETFTDRADPSTFYLLTRWTDEPSFRAWHNSEAHHRSHRSIPKGVRLDPKFTEIIALERIQDATTDREFGLAAADAATALGAMLAESQSLHLLISSRDGRVLRTNPTFARLRGRTCEALVGTSVYDWLLPADAASLRDRIAAGRRNPDESFLLNFVNEEGAPATLCCRLDLWPEAFVLLAEPHVEAEAALRDQLLDINATLSVLHRELAQKNRELTQARQELEQTLKHLQDSYWHLKKIQEVLPVCMVCNKFKTASGGWAGIIEYLRENELFVSHGLCPECGEQMMKDFRRSAQGGQP